MHAAMRAGWQALPLVWTLLAGAPALVWAQAAPAPDGAAAAADRAAATVPVRMDAVVTDQAGRRVLTLLPGDFELTVNGESRPLPGLEVRTPPRPRVFAIYLDEYHVSPGLPTERVRAALSRFIDVHLRPTDRVAIIKPLQPVSRVRFADDLRSLRDAVAAFSGRKGDLAPRSAFEEQFIGHAPSAVAAARAQIVTLALTELAVQLGELGADRAALVLVSAGFQRGTQGLSLRQGRLPDLQGVARAASRYHFAVYTLSPEDVPGDTPAAATLAWLAHQTGGVSVTEAGRLDAGLGQVASDMDGYYALELPASARDGRFHRVEISARRAGLQVRASPGYWAPLSSEVRALFSGSPAPSGPPRLLRRSPLIEAWVGLRPAGEGRLALMLSWTQAQGAAAGVQQLSVTARSETGDVLFEGRLAAAGASEGPDAAARFIAAPGRVHLDMELLNVDGGVLDTDIRDVYVPQFTSDVALALLPPEVLRARTVPEYRRILEDEAAVPTPVRAFVRSDRLVIRTPVWQSAGRTARVSARVLNRRGQHMRAIEALPSSPDGVAAFDLPLAWLAPGEYYIEVSAEAGEHRVGERIFIRVAN